MAALKNTTYTKAPAQDPKKQGTRLPAMCPYKTRHKKKNKKNTNSTAQSGGGRFKDRKPMGGWLL
jgi:hypothetical protein